VPYFYGLTRAHSASLIYVRIPPPPIVLGLLRVFGILGFSLCVFVVPSRDVCARDTTVLELSKIAPMIDVHPRCVRRRRVPPAGATFLAQVQHTRA